MQVFCSLAVLSSQTGILKGLEKNEKSQRGGGVNNFGIQRAWGYSVLKFFRRQG